MPYKNEQQGKEYRHKYFLEHKEYIAEKTRKYRLEHKEHIKELYISRRKEVLGHYGGKCTCCGETTYEFLAIDHINNDGAKHRREVGGSRGLFLWLRRHNYPDGFQILCHNCNCAKAYYGECPHKKLVNI
jgi:hypothetical protein